eukprot:CAMPEP_0182891206 /NCGR_PEP_ID=MMETSP0034_2-20130328/23118_1 /TAXON_ID=156128 /ORGANISM="Nephroselmis pyriformis, Strain CCMP717" /LENGTH=65 /DNA_ID=CAMNT_0025024803 /DNA_START=45 /DNA_END=238 /DNA_ORIENTATION=+
MSLTAGSVLEDEIYEDKVEDEDDEEEPHPIFTAWGAGAGDVEGFGLLVGGLATAVSAVQPPSRGS